MYPTFSYLYLLIICPLIYVSHNWFLLLISFPMYSTKKKKKKKKNFFSLSEYLKKKKILHLSYTSLLIQWNEKEHTKEAMNIQK